MEILTVLQYYLIAALGLSLTSYFLIFRPTLDLSEEILDREIIEYRGTIGFVVWTLVTTIMAPITLLVLLRSENDLMIQKLALSLTDKIMEDEE